MFRYLSMVVPISKTEHLGTYGGQSLRRLTVRTFNNTII